jgi:dTDP-4-dehydrorhamnose reductase
VKVLVTGPGGMVGSYLTKILAEKKVEVIPMYRHHHIRERMEQVPDAIIHLAAYTNVTASNANPYQCFKDNVELTHDVAWWAQDLNIPMINVSTVYVDAVFENGYGEAPWEYYTYTKALGEAVVEYMNHPKLKTIRTGALFGLNAQGKDHKFVGTMIKAYEEGRRSFTMNKQWVMPTYAKDLAEDLAYRIMHPDFEMEPYLTYFFNDTDDMPNHGVQLKDYAKEVFRLIGAADEAITFTDRPGDMIHYEPGDNEVDWGRHWKKALAAYIKGELS